MFFRLFYFFPSSNFLERNFLFFFFEFNRELRINSFKNSEKEYFIVIVVVVLSKKEWK